MPPSSTGRAMPTMPLTSSAIVIASGLICVGQLVGQLQVRDGVAVDVGAEVVVVAAERFAQAVIEVDHAGHAVEAEAVEAELLQPVADVAQQEPLHFVLAVVEQQRIPRDVLPARRRRGNTGSRCRRSGSSPSCVFFTAWLWTRSSSTRDAQAVGGVDQRLQLLRRAEAAS